MSSAESATTDVAPAVSAPPTVPTTDGPTRSQPASIPSANLPVPSFDDPASLPGTYLASVITSDPSTSAHPTFSVQSLPLPSLSPTSVLVRLTATSVCGSDVSLAQGHMGWPLSRASSSDPSAPRVLGHEGVGRIVSLGGAAAAVDAGLRVGMRVGVGWTRDWCGGSCAWCGASGQGEPETRCAVKAHSGRSVDGTFAQVVEVPAGYVFKVPEEEEEGGEGGTNGRTVENGGGGKVAATLQGRARTRLTDAVVAPLLCAGLTGYRAVVTAGSAASGGSAPPGSWIAVVGGGGGVGAYACAFATALGYRVVAVDVGAARGQYVVEELRAAERYVDVLGTDERGEKVDVGMRVKEITGTGANAGEGAGAAAVIVAAGSGKAYASAWGMLRPHGTLVCVGIPPPQDLSSFHPVMMVANGFRVVGSAVGSRRDLADLLELVACGKVGSLPRAVEVDGGLEKVEEVVGRLSRGEEVMGKYVIKIE